MLWWRWVCTHEAAGVCMLSPSLAEAGQCCSAPRRSPIFSTCGACLPLSALLYTRPALHRACMHAQEVELHWEKRLRDGMAACERKFSEESRTWERRLAECEQGWVSKLAEMEALWSECGSGSREGQRALHWVPRPGRTA